MVSQHKLYHNTNSHMDHINEINSINTVIGKIGFMNILHNGIYLLMLADNRCTNFKASTKLYTIMISRNNSQKINYFMICYSCYLSTKMLLFYGHFNAQGRLNGLSELLR